MASDEQEFVVLGVEDIQDFNDGGLLPLSSEDTYNIQEWLLPTDYSADSSEYGKHLAAYLPGTGNWILETETYTRWHESSEYGSLWMKAIPGAGKSVYAAQLASKIASQEAVPVLYFFFRQTIIANQKPHSLVRDYLSQLLSYSPLLQCKLKKFLDDRRSLESVSFDELWWTLQSALSLLPRVYCVVDALDEMDTGNESFMDSLIKLGQHSPTTIKVLMTSRPVPRFEKILNSPSVLQIILQQQLVDQDIAVYINHRLSGSNLSEHARSTILQTMCIKANGLFLYARLMMDDVLDPSKDSFTNERNMLDALSRLPATLADMYTGMLLEHSRRSGVPQPIQIIILRWVTKAERPLRLLELAGMIDFEQKALWMSQDTKSTVRAGCGPLLEILEDETVCVIHHSFTEFLFDIEGDYAVSEHERRHRFPPLNHAVTQRAIAITCISYLTSDWLDDWEVQPRGRAAETFNPKHTRQGVKLKYPFLDYAATNWHRHLVKYGLVDAEIFVLLDDFFLKNTRAFYSWLDLIRPGEKFYKLTPMHVAAHENLSHYTEHLLHLGLDIECMDYSARTPLFIAAMQGHHQTVAVLLENGAQNDRDDHYGLKPLIQAARANHHLVVKQILEAGVAPFTPKTKENPGRRCGNAPTTIGDTAVKYACQYGHVETIEAFMQHLGRDDLELAIYWATRSGSTKVVMALLESPVIDINSATPGETPLFLAAAAHDTTTMRVLLDKGADVHIKSDHDFHHGGGRYWRRGYIKSKCTPLHAFARACNSHSGESKDDLRIKDGFEMLLTAGCDVNAVDGSGLTALHCLVSGDCFSSHGNTSWLANAVSLLLSRGASASTLTADGSSPLHLLSGSSNTVVDLLVQNGADVNAIRKSDGKSPLMTFLSNYYCAGAKALLVHGADCNFADPNGWTPLHFLASQYTVDRDIYEALLQAGANPDARNQDGDTPLHMMTNLSVEVLSLFLEYHACLETKNNKGYTVLLKNATGWGSKDTFKTLVEAGADVHAVDIEGSTVMHLACNNINDIGTTTTQVLRYFVDKGVDPKRTDNDGNTLLHEAAKKPADYNQKEQANILDLILEFGVRPSARNHYGETAIHLAFSHAQSQYPYSPLDFLLGPKCNLEVDVADMKGIRPIHLTATFSESLTARLLKLGADPTAMTIEGQSPLMIACRTRQSNIVGLLVDHHRKHGHCAFVDCIDLRRRSALHYASRSGRHETVKILLDAGANPNLRDNKGLTPLHACAEFSKEARYWTDPDAKKNGYVNNDAAHVLLDDRSRPSKAGENSDPVGIRESIRLLVTYGADITFVDTIGQHPTHPFLWNRTSNPLETAITAECEAMVDELLSLRYRDSISKSINPSDDDARLKGHRLESFSGQLLLLKSRYMPDVLKRVVRRGESNIDVVCDLLRMEHEPGIIEMNRLGADLLKPNSSGESPIRIMAKWGFVSLMKKLGMEASKMDEAWIKDIETTKVNPPGRLRPILLVACERELPNLEMIKLLVEGFGVDVNELDAGDSNSYQPQRSALHILATGSYWWQPKALEYLIERGADIEVKDSKGDTALLIASSDRHPNAYAGVEAIKFLLRAGGNPNVLDKDGLTCLNRVAKEPELVRLLVEHGADPMLGKKPFIFDAIEVKDLDAIHILIESGVNCDIRCQPEKEDESRDEDEDEDELTFRSHRRTQLQYVPSAKKFFAEDSYPIQLAASRKFNNTESKAKMIPIINTLLRGGANPFLICSNGDSVLHNLARQGGILEPFLTLSSVDLDARDSQGRTLLLAACSGGYSRSHQDTTGHIVSLLVSHGASIDAVDNAGRNGLHCIISSREEHGHIHNGFDTMLSLPDGPALVAAKDATGCTPLHYALRNHSFDIVDALLRHGADPTELDPTDGSMALHHIAKAIFSKYNHDCRGYFREFLARGLDINARDSSGETALFRLVATPSPASNCHGLSYMVTLPLFEEAGANFKVRNDKGEGLLHRLASTELTQVWWSGKGQEEDMVALFRNLLEKGCDPAWEDDKQRTCLDVAAAAENNAVLELFQRKTVTTERREMED